MSVFQTAYISRTDSFWLSVYEQRFVQDEFEVLISMITKSTVFWGCDAM
jgi:hypothetical protein